MITKVITIIGVRNKIGSGGFFSVISRIEYVMFGNINLDTVC
jgi:hypothetical protein